MKFTDGYWLMREGVRALYPVAVHDVAATADSLTVFAPTRPVRDRGDLLNVPVVTATYTSPMPGVIAVEIVHHDGAARRGPEFVLHEHGVDGVTVETGDDGVASLTSGDLSVRVSRGDRWAVEFVGGGRVLTSSGFKAAAFLDVDGRHYVREQLDLGVDDAVYGLGERFGPLVKNGQTVDIWNADGGTASEQAYKNVPFYLTNAGYGVFVDHPGHVSLEVASEAASRVQFSVEGQRLRYLVIHGPTPKEILRRYTALTGRPARLPAWSFGLWLTTSFTTSYDEATVSHFVDEMARRELPLSVFHFDTFWMRGLSWCDFTWDPDQFPDPAGMLDRLKARGLRVCVWINPYIAQRSPLFAEGRARGYLLRKPNGDVWQTDLWQPGMAIVDFTNAEARQWFADKLDSLLEMGVDCFKTDFGERIPTDVVWADGSDPSRVHNYYSYLYNKAVFDLLQKRRGESKAVLFARSATAGSQQFPVHWGGDCESTFVAMAQELRGGLSLGMSGFGYWSHDIGGFEGTPDHAVFKRWLAFGLLSSHSRLHGSGSYRVPWAFDEEAVDVLRTFTRLKLRLMPYLATVAREAYEQGLPMMRAMVVEHPDDPACTHLDRQYHLGADLLVAPVLGAGEEVRYYVPAGVWTDIVSGEEVVGGRWVTDHHGFHSVPLLARPGSVIPVGAVEDRPDYDYADGVTLHAHRLEDGATVATELVTTTGDPLATFRTTRDGRSVRVEATGARGGWRLLLVGVRAVHGVEGGEAGDHPLGVLVEPAGPTVVVDGVGYDEPASGN